MKSVMNHDARNYNKERLHRDASAKKKRKEIKHDASFCLIEHLTAAFELLENVCSNTTI